MRSLELRVSQFTTPDPEPPTRLIDRRDLQFDLADPEGDGALPSYEDGFWDSLRAGAQDLADTPLDWAKQFFGIGEVADAVLSAKLEDLGRYYEQPDRRDLLRGRLQETLLRNADNKRRTLISQE